MGIIVRMRKAIRAKMDDHAEDAMGKVVAISIGVLVFVIVYVIIDAVITANPITDPLLAIVVPAAASIGAVLGVYSTYKASQ